jgi:LmbE family N-acetylglucosaminyl deacetylase
MGAAGLVQLLERLQTTASVLHTGAHPDDEDSAFIARAARGDHARVAYLALNRGEGGQNIIGSELFDALGVIRTEELLQARRLDGGEQFFTRAFDFGFSKTRSETAARWNERDVLGDMVRVIRLFRPLVIYSRFSGTPADGHGHHQMAGYLTPLAFRAAADPDAFPELAREGLRPWQARKLYVGVGRQAPSAAPLLELATGIVDPAIGRSYAEIAAQGRSQHKSQEMGSIEPLGPSTSALRLLESRVAPASTERSVFDGIDVSIRGLAALAGLAPGAIDPQLSAMSDAAEEALRTYRPLDPAAIVPVLAAGLRATRNARAALASTASAPAAVADADFLLAKKEAEFADALARAAGVVVDPLASDETVPQGGSTDVTVRTFLEDTSLARVTSTTVRAPREWRVSPVTAEPQRNVGFPGRRETPAYSSRYRLTVPDNAPPTEPYFLERPRGTADMYIWPDDAPKALPFDPPLVTAVVALEVAGTPITISEAAVYRYGDPIRGEIRRPLNVVPAIAVGLDAPLLIVPSGAAPYQHRVVARATSYSAQPVDGTVGLRVPEGWTVSPAQATFALARRGDSTSVPFVVTAPARRVPGEAAIAVEARANGRLFTRDVQVIAYPHIQTHRLYSDASARVRVLDVKVAPVRVGYIVGTGDDVPNALGRMGIDVTLIDDNALAFGDLSHFDTIVVGIRAAEARPAFVAHYGRLREFMERGGTLIVQYQQQEYVAAGLPPYPAQMAGNSRVTDERAAVKILAPEHPLFTFPNRITAADFEGWVQERNLYALTGFDSHYTPLLESADPAEPPQRGGELYADVGRGRFVYTAYAWFRQLPAGVPGAYRLFANLVSLPRAPRAGSPARGAAPRTGAGAPPAAGRTRQSR